MPGHYVTGSLYRPKGRTGKLPAVLCPHGHWKDGRFHAYNDKELKAQIAIGAERFLAGGRYPLQSRCVQLARMGCVVFHYDMIGYADSVQLAHRPGVRQAMNTAENWGFFSPQAELRLQNMMGLQTWNSIRAFDFLSALPDVDPERIAVTGASGGGTQTFLLLAVDDRPAAGLPCVMVSTSMQGGCTCENATYLRIGAGNIDLAALAAPRPLALTAADDWTRELRTKGFPDLASLYKMLDREDVFEAAFHTHFEHNYNSVNRMFIYDCVNRFLELGFESPILERDFVPLSQDEMTVWTGDHPRPEGDQVGDTHERALLQWWAEDARRQIDDDAKNRDDDHTLAGGAWDVILGGHLEDMGEAEIKLVTKTDLAGCQLKLALVNRTGGGAQLPIALLHPAGNWNGAYVLWTTDRGKAGLFNSDDAPSAAVQALLDAGYGVVGVDCFYQGEFLPDGSPLVKARLNLADNDESEAWKHAAAYTFGYNRPLFAQRVRDILTVLRAMQSAVLPAKTIHLVGVGREAGPLVLAARLQSGEAVGKTAVHTDQFQFTSVTRLDDPMFVPGAVKYGDVEGLVRLIGNADLWINRTESPESAAAPIASWLIKGD
jgi:dienelactone hydrolase